MTASRNNLRRVFYLCLKKIYVFQLHMPRRSMVGDGSLFVCWVILAPIDLILQIVGSAPLQQLTYVSQRFSAFRLIDAHPRPFTPRHSGVSVPIFMPFPPQRKNLTYLRTSLFLLGRPYINHILQGSLYRVLTYPRRQFQNSSWKFSSEGLIIVQILHFCFKLARQRLTFRVQFYGDVSTECKSMQIPCLCPKLLLECLNNYGFKHLGSLLRYIYKFG